MPIYFLSHEYRLNCGLTRCFLNHLDWVDLSQCDLDQCESSWNLFIPVYDWVNVIPIYRIFALNFLRFRIIFALIIMKVLFSPLFSLGFYFRISFFHATARPCRQNLKPCWPIWRCWSCLFCYTLALWSQWVLVVSSRCGYRFSAHIWEH